MAYRAWVCLASLAVTIGGCAVVDPVDSRYDTIGRSLAKARNESIFLNLVRASHDYPLSFTAISNVTPTMTNVSGFSLPSFLFGPGAQFSTTVNNVTSSLPSSSPGRDVVFGNSTASNSISVSSNFNVATQETSAFYDGFLKPIDLTTLNYFIRQGYPPELLFWLFTDSFEITHAGRTLGYRYNPPQDYGCNESDRQKRCFVDWVIVATQSGLTVEEETQQKSGSAKSGDSAAPSKPTTTTFSRFCFNSVLSERELAAMDVTGNKKLTDLAFFSQLNPRCGSNWNPLTTASVPQRDTLPLQLGNGDTFRIVPRSAYGVFQFLGVLMKVQLGDVVPLKNTYIPEKRKTGDEPNNVLLPPALNSVVYQINGVAKHAKLIEVIKGSTDEPCFVHTWFNDGDYCVPDSAANTKRVFSLLAQLIAIQTAPSDLSITPIVRVIQ